MHIGGQFLRATIVGAALLAGVAHAQPALLTDADRAQLARWLGEGPIGLTSIFTKAPQMSAADFHAAVDGKGRTLVVMEATNKRGESYLLGGYNPLSWSSSGDYSMTPDDVDRTSFLFNLTAGKIHRQMLRGVGTEAVGAYQALNDPDGGPTFGWGHDLRMSKDLATGYSLLYSYADGSLADMNLSIADGTAWAGMDDLRFGRMEVYTISAVPEPATALLLTTGLGVMLAGAAYRRRTAKKAAA